MNRSHRRAWWRPWRCTCGHRWYCGAYDAARTDVGRIQARQATEWYPQYFATRAPAALRFTPPANPTRPAVGRAQVPPARPVIRPYVKVGPYNRGRFR
jgi:hypothetical protein